MLPIDPAVYGIITALVGGVMYAAIGYTRSPANEAWNQKRFLNTMLTVTIAGLALVALMPPDASFRDYITLFLAVIGADAIRTTGSPKPPGGP